MWNNLLVCGICLFSLNFLSLSKSMEFPNTKFTVQQAWKNQHRRVDTPVLRKLACNTCLHEATPQLARRKRARNKANMPSDKENRIFNNIFFTSSTTTRSHRKKKNHPLNESIKEDKFDINNDTIISMKNSSKACSLNNSTLAKSNFNTTKNSHELQRNSFDVNRTYTEGTRTPHTPTRRVKNFKFQLPLNGCANNACEIKTTQSPISDLLNISNRRRYQLSDAYDRDNDAKNFNVVHDNQINENLMRTKRAILKAHHRIDTPKKLNRAEVSISVTDYPINVNFHSSSQPKHFKNSQFDISLPENHCCVLPLTNRSDNYHQNIVNETDRLSIDVTGNRAEAFTKEPISKNDTRYFYHTNHINGKTSRNLTETNISSSIENKKYRLNVTELNNSHTGNYRYNRIIKNRNRSKTKRQSKNEKTDLASQTSSSISPFFTATEATVAERIQINEDKAITIEYYDNSETRKSTNVTSQPNDTYKNNFKNTTTTNIVKTNGEISTKNLITSTMKMTSLVKENFTMQNSLRGKDFLQSEKLRRLSSSCGTSSANTTKKTIFILGLFALTNGPSNRTAGQSEIAAASLAIEHINQMQILGCEYELKLLVNNTQEDPGVALNNFFYAMYKDQQKKIKALLGSSNAEVTHALAKITLAWDIPTISFGFSSPQLSDNKKYPMFFRTVAPDSSHNQARIAFLNFFKWNSIITICQQQDLYSWGINDLSTKLEESNITQEKTISFSEQDFEAHLKLMPEQDSKIIVASFSNDVAPKFFCAVHDMGLYGGDYVWILPGTLENRWWNTNKYCSKQKLIEAVNGLILISSKKQLDEDEFAVSFVNEKEFQNLLPELKSEFVREAYDAVWAAALSLNRTLSSCKHDNADCLNTSFHKSFQKQFVNNFQYIQFKGTSGPILFHGADRICITNFYQIQDGEIFPIAQFDPLTLKLSFNCSNCKDIIWPSGYIPVSKRTYELHIMNVTPVAFYVINFLAVLGILVSLCFLVFNIYYREQKYIKLSSPYLNATTIMGCILVYLGVIFLGIDNSTMPPAFTFPTICTARVALLSTGCSLAFGSIFAKTYRVHQIFIKSNHGILKSKVLQDSRLVPIIGVFVLIDGVIIVIWTAIDPMEHDLYNLTLEASVSHPEIIHQIQVEVCKSEYKNTWLFALGIYKAVFFILGLYMAWETRNVKIPSLNDSEYIGLTVYTVLVTTVLHFTLANVTSDRITLAYVTTTSLILFTTTSSMCLLFLPKINAIFKHKDSAHKKIVSSSDLKIESNTIRFVKNDDQEPYYRVHIQNFAYRKYVAFLDREIQNLHYKVYIKKNDDPDLLARRATKIYDKIPNLRKYRREKSSSLCGGIPNLFMLTVFPVVIPRASWPYAEHLDRPITEEMSFSSETKLQSIRFEDAALNSRNRDSEDEDQPKCEGSAPCSPSKKVFDHDEYQDTSSDVEEDHNHPSSVLKICKAIVHSPLSDEEVKRLDQPPRIMITDTEALNGDCPDEIDAIQQLEI